MKLNRLENLSETLKAEIAKMHSDINTFRLREAKTLLHSESARNAVEAKLKRRIRAQW